MAPGVYKYKCSANGCNNKFYFPVSDQNYKNKGFFNFPSDLERRKQWFDIMNIPFKSTRCCSAIYHNNL